MGPAERIAGPHHILDALHFLLVAVTVLHGSFLCFLQCTLQRLNSLSCRPKTFLQFWKLTAKICIVVYQLSHTRTHTVISGIVTMQYILSYMKDIDELNIF